MSSPRIHCGAFLASGALVELPSAAARHVQVLRLQPGHSITVFNGQGGQWEATIERMGRSDVTVRIGAHAAIEREAARSIHVAVGMPANDRMDWLVEKATELGVASLQPLTVERSVLRLSGERSAKKQQHWEGIAIAACEQCGRNRVPRVYPVLTLRDWLESGVAAGMRLLLAPEQGAASLRASVASSTEFTLLSGPEGGLSASEQAAARASGFTPANLGARILRAETAPLAALAVLTLGV